MPCRQSSVADDYNAVRGGDQQSGFGAEELQDAVAALVVLWSDATVFT